MRLIVLAPNRESGIWAAKKAKADILSDIGYVLSERQTRVFSADEPDTIRGFSLQRGDHVVHVPGWDEDDELEMNWRLAQRITHGVWYSDHEGENHG